MLRRGRRQSCCSHRRQWLCNFRAYAGETSPYLLQHAHNPVDWYPWGPEALARAREENKPIFLSIGYAACHWCHVMERESFEDAATAEDLNRDFVAIKVDREERPDLDQVYMAAVQAMTGQGGWPMSVFLTPDGKPFYGGTYFPPQPAHGMPAFRQVLAGVARAWRDEPLEVLAAGSRLVDALVQQQAGPATGDAPTRALLDTATAAIEASFDATNGGWGGAPEVPAADDDRVPAPARGHDRRPATARRRAAEPRRDGRRRDPRPAGRRLPPLRDRRDLAGAALREDALRQRPAGAGLYPRLAGDRRPALSRGRGDTLDYMLRELRRDDGTFAASQDADTDGVEGATFTWTAAEIRGVLGADAPPFLEAYGVTDGGNWEHTNILSRVVPPTGDPAAEVGLADARARLLAHRGARPQPARDDKALAAWNGLAIAAFAEAARALAEVDVRVSRAIVAAADALLEALRTPGQPPQALVEGRPIDRRGRPRGLHAPRRRPPRPVRGDLRRALVFAAARDLMDQVLERFADPAGGFFDTADDHEALVTRPKDVQDNAVPAGGSMAASVLLRLAALTGEARYRVAADGALATVAPFPDRYPTGFAQWLNALDFALADVVEVAIVGAPDDGNRGALAPLGGGLPPEPGARRRGRPGGIRRPADGRPRPARRPADRLRLPQLRLPPAGHGRRRAATCGSRLRWVPWRRRGRDWRREVRPRRLACGGRDARRSGEARTERRPGVRGPPRKLVLRGRRSPGAVALVDRACGLRGLHPGRS